MIRNIFNGLIIGGNNCDTKIQTWIFYLLNLYKLSNFFFKMSDLCTIPCLELQNYKDTV